MPASVDFDFQYCVKPCQSTGSGAFGACTGSACPYYRGCGLEHCDRAGSAAFDIASVTRVPTGFVGNGRPGGAYAHGASSALVDGSASR